MTDLRRFTPKICLYGDCKTAGVYMDLDSKGRFVLYDEAVEADPEREQ